MATKTKKTKSEIKEREYVVPLRVEWRKVPRYKRAAKAIKAIREFLVQHMRIYDRDLKKIKIAGYLNEFVWFRGIKRPPHKVKVKARMEGENVRVELAELPAKLKFKKARADKLEAKAKEGKEKKRSLKEKVQDTITGKPAEEKKESEEEKKEEKEKAKAGEEAITKMEKAKSKERKHSTGGKMKQKTQPVRKALNK